MSVYAAGQPGVAAEASRQGASLPFRRAEIH